MGPVGVAPPTPLAQRSRGVRARHHRQRWRPAVRPVQVAWQQLTVAAPRRPAQRHQIPPPKRRRLRRAGQGAATRHLEMRTVAARRRRRMRPALPGAPRTQMPTVERAAMDWRKLPTEEAVTPMRPAQRDQMSRPKCRQRRQRTAERAAAAITKSAREAAQRPPAQRHQTSRPKRQQRRMADQAAVHTNYQQVRRALQTLHPWRPPDMAPWRMLNRPRADRAAGPSRLRRPLSPA